MEVRAARRTEIPEIAELWAHTFPDGPSRADRIETLETGGAAGGVETVTVAVEGGRLAGALKSLRFNQHIGGAGLPMFGLSAVGVAPWARRRGVARDLCEHALREAHGRGDVVSALYPFRPLFYRRLGWALAGCLHRWWFTPEQLADPGDPDVRLAHDADIPGVDACYARFARRSNGLIDRDPDRWERIRGPADTHTFIAPGDGRLDGYLVVRYGSAHSGERRPLYICELIADAPTAYGRLLRFVSRQRDLWRRIRYDASPDERFGDFLSDPRPPGYAAMRRLWFQTATIIRGPMVRIVNVPKAFQARHEWGSREPFGFMLHVDDPQLPGNVGPWAVSFDGDSVTARKAADVEPGAGGAQLFLDTPTLAELYTGESTPSEAVRLGRARIDGDAAAFDAFFRPASSFRLLDEF
jgi:predicted acetyltransferase